MNPYIICNAVLHCTVLNLKFSGNSRKIFGNSSKISENSSKILKNSIYRKFQLRALPPKLRKNKPAIQWIKVRVKVLQSIASFWTHRAWNQNLFFWRTTAFSWRFQKYMGCPVSSCMSGVLGLPGSNIISN